MKKALDALLVVGLSLLPFSTSPDSFYVITFGLPFLFCLAILFCLHIFENNCFEDKYIPALKAAIFLVLTQIISWVYAPDLVASGARLFTNLVGLMVFCYLLSSQSFPLKLLRTQKRFSLVDIVVVSGAILSAYFLFNFLYVSLTNDFDRVISQRYVGGLMSLPWGASNVIASPLLFPFFLAFDGYKFAVDKRAKGFYLGSSLLMLMTIIISFSRGAQLSLIFGLLILVLAGFVRFRTIALAGLAIVLIIFSFDELLFFRFFNSNLFFLNGRWEIWRDYLGYIQSAPLIGRGFYSSMFLHEVSGHNIILTTLAERGLAGLFLASLILVEAASVTISKIRLVAPTRVRAFYLFAASGGMASLLHLLLEDANFSQPYIIYSWVYLAIIFTAEDQLLKGEAAYAPE